ncbi:hypothetical protein [Nocardioides lacusdianchii]|uniref:hypothetical protein n=1 Tax=Nocardioides lacusdianchii TaxID=2783664 RepID=UPI001CCF3EAE|nr:hypothetical protein [Nocardioides lacusdianchii]
MSTPADSPSAAADRDPVQEARDHLEQALAALDRLREVLPPPSSTPPSDTGGGEPA